MKKIVFFLTMFLFALNSYSQTCESLLQDYKTKKLNFELALSQTSDTSALVQLAEEAKAALEALNSNCSGRPGWLCGALHAVCWADWLSCIRSSDTGPMQCYQRYVSCMSGCTVYIKEAEAKTIPKIAARVFRR